jgi:hypothetical protein
MSIFKKKFILLAQPKKISTIFENIVIVHRRKERKKHARQSAATSLHG